jgi:hypothetical protein
MKKLPLAAIAALTLTGAAHAAPLDGVINGESVLCMPPMPAEFDDKVAARARDMWVCVQKLGTPSTQPPSQPVVVHIGGLAMTCTHDQRGWNTDHTAMLDAWLCKATQ